MDPSQENNTTVRYPGLIVEIFLVVLCDFLFRDFNVGNRINESDLSVMVI